MFTTDSDTSPCTEHVNVLHAPLIRFAHRPRFSLALIWVIALGIYLVGAVRQSSHLNLSATAGGQYPYLLYAKGMGEQGVFTYVGDRNRMPLYPAMLSLVYDKDWSTFVARSKWFAIGTSLLFLLIVVAVLYYTLPTWPVTAIGLMAAFLVYLPKSSFVQAELAYYALLLCTCVAFCALLPKPTWRRSVLAGTLAGATFLTKGSGLAIVFAFTATVIVASGPALARAIVHARRNRNVAFRSDGYGKCLGCAALSVGVFLAVIYPYLATNKERYGHWFYNVNSTFFMWCDNWPQATAFAAEYDIAHQYPHARAASIPGPVNYWRTHTLGQIARRFTYGLSTLARLAWHGAYLKYLIASALVCICVLIRRVRNGEGLDKDERITGLLVLIAGMGYLIGYSWYVPIGYGARFILSLVIPLTLWMWWLSSNRKTCTSQGMKSKSGLRRIWAGAALDKKVAICLIPLLLAEGVYASLVRVTRPPPQFVRFYYNESVERLRAGDAEEAEHGFRGVARLDPNAGAPRRDLGMIALSGGRIDEAVAWLEQATQVEPDNADGWNSLGGAYLAAKRAHAAIAAFERATSLDPHNAIAWFNLGGAYARIGARHKARAALDRLRKLNDSLATRLEKLLEE